MRFMNLNGEEKRIQQLFVEMSSDDQRLAPQFATLLAAAYSRTERSQNRTRSGRFALAVAILCVAMLIAMAIIERPSKPQGAAAPDDQALAPIVPPGAPPNVVLPKPDRESPSVAPRVAIIKNAGHRRTSNRLAIAMKSMFEWQSPTASLLQTRSDELLRSLPRLGESLRTIKSYSPDEFN